MWVITGVLPIIYDYYAIQNEFFLVLNASFAGEGALLIFLGIFAYFHSLPGKFVFIISFIYLIIPFFLYTIFGSEFALTIGMSLYLLTYIIIYIGVTKTSQEMKKVFSKGVKFFYLTIGSVIVTIGAIAALNLVVEDGINSCDFHLHRTRNYC